MNKKLHKKIKWLKNVRILYIITFCFTIMAVNSSFATPYSEFIEKNQIITSKKISLNIENKSIRYILIEIQKQSGIGISFKDNGIINKLKPVSINIKEQTIDFALNQLLKGTSLTYQIEDNVILITKSKSTPIKSKEVQVKGRVLDDDNNSIVGATVLVKNTSSGAITDNKGEFILRCKIGDVLEVDFLGMLQVKKEITKSETDLVIKMMTDNLAVDDVVVTGIFNRSRESYTGAVTTITAKDIKMFKGQNLLATLRNIDPALNIVQNNNFGSDPNRLPEVNIRGNSSLPTSITELNDLEQNANAQLNTPLVIMDGFEISLQRLMDFNDEEIAGINILKDASATAIYGSKGANGVIVITTKTPEAGKIKIFAQFGINIEMPDLSSYDLLNARDKLNFEKKTGLYLDANRPDDYLPSGEKEYYRVFDDINRGVDTYWMSQPLTVGIGQRYGARLEGGSKMFRWSASLNYNKNNGVMKGSDRDNFDGSINLTYNHKNIKFQNQLSLSFNEGNNGNYGSFSDYTKMNQYWAPKDEDGNFVKMFTSINGTSKQEVANPLYDTQFAFKDFTNSINISNNFSVEWNVFKDFTIRGKIGLSKNINSSDKFRSAHDTHFEDFSEADYFRKGDYLYSTGQGFNYDIGVTANYSTVIADKHQIYAGLDYTVSQKEDFSYSMKAEGFSDDKFSFIANAGSFEEHGKPGGDESITRSLGLTTNISYTYDNRYFADASVRIDGASQFGAKNRFAPFYSAGIGWNIHREEFFKNSVIISNFRVRASYGRSGSQQFDAYKSLTTYEYYLEDKYMLWNGTKLLGYGNENLKWQTTDQVNLGVELAIFNNRLSGSVDVYDKRTSRLLSELDIPLVTGYSSYTENIGAIKNFGIEASLSGYIIRDTKNNIVWTLSAKIAHNKNEITELSDALIAQNEKYLEDNKNESIRLLYEGHSQNSIYAVKSLGIDPSNGKEVLLDRDGNLTYEYNPNAVYLVGVSEPKIRGNISSMFSYKNLSINLSFGYQMGGQQDNFTLRDRVEITKHQARYNVDRRVYEDRWMKPGDVSFYKGISSDSDNSRLTSRFIQDDNMFSLQSASVQYRWNSKWVKDNLKMQSLNLGVNMSDLFYVSTIKRERGLDYPFSRKVSVSLSFIF